MAGPFETQIGIGIKDNATPGIARIRNEVQRMQEARERLGVNGEHAIRRAIQQTEAALNRLARNGSLSAAELSRAQEKAAAKIARLQKEMSEAEVQSYTRRNTAREAYAALGIRSEHNIQREIQRTEAAYNRLERSGALSSGELQRAQEKTISTVARLRRELGETTREQSRLVSGFKMMGGLAAGFAGAKMVLGQPIAQQRDFDAELHTASNFIYRDKNTVAERLQGVNELKDQIYNATSYGGGTREEALAAAEMLARSKMTKSEVFAGLPEVMKIHTATGTDARDVASLLTSTYNFGLTGSQNAAALDAATTAAQHGKADVSLLAREAPRGLENARGAGFTGTKGFADVMALYEVASSIAGSADEGATNTNDLITELSSTNLANSAKRVKIHGRKLDYKSMATNDALRGHNALYTLEHMVQAVDANDEKMKGWQKALTSTTDPKKRENLQRSIDERHRQNVGLFLHNQQSANAFLGYERNVSQYEAISGDVQAQFTKPEGQRSTDIDFGVMKDTANYKDQQLNTQKQKSSDSAVKPLSDGLGDLELKVARLAEEFPRVATAAEGAAIAMTAVAAAGAFKGGYDLLTGRNGGLLKRLTGAGVEVAENAGVNAVEDVAGGVASKPGWMSRLGGAIAGGGKWLYNGGKTIVTDGLLDNPLTLPVTAGIAAMWPASTVGNGDEQNELQRLKSRNQKLNSVPTSAEALQMLQSRNGQIHTGANAPVIQLPQQPAPVVNLRVFLDGNEISSHMTTQAERNARRYGA